MKPGLNLNVSEAAYHAFPAVSKSTLWKFAKNPAKWFKTRHEKLEPTASMVWGSLVDCLVLQPHELAECFAVSSFADFRTKEAQAWRDSQTVPVITLAQVEEAKKAAELIRAHHFAGAMLDGSTCQVSALSEGLDPETGERFTGKCRVDIVPGASGAFGDWLIDLKTTQSIAKLPSTIADFGYHVQAAWYLDMFNAASGEDRTRWGFIFQESEAPYEIAVVELDPEDIAAGRKWYLRALSQWCQSHKTGNFPSPWDDEIKVVSLPGWARKWAECE